MGTLHPFRKSPRKPSRWTRAEAYVPRRAPMRPAARWFPFALVALPLAAFTAVLLAPTGKGVREAEGAARVFIPDDSPRSAAALDAEQPDLVAMGPKGARVGSGVTDREQARFAPCAGPVRVTCVVDGDTLWYEGEKIRIADADTPEVFSPGCSREAELGRRATARLTALLNAGPFSLEPDPEGETVDRYGRSLKVVTRGGQSLGAVLVREGLAERWGGPRRSWCGA